MSKRDEIVLQALALIDESGIRNLTLPAIFDAAQTGAGTFYHYFSGREELIDAVFVYCADIAWHELVPNDDASLDPHVRFLKFCKNIFRAYRDHPLELDFLYAYSFGYIVRFGDGTHTIPSLQVLESILSEAQKRRCISPDISPRVASHVFRGMIASYYWCSRFDTYEMTDKSAIDLAQRAWQSVNSCPRWICEGCNIAAECHEKHCVSRK